MTRPSAAHVPPRILPLLEVVRPRLARVVLAAAAAYCYATGDRLGLLVVLAAAAGRLLTHLTGHATDALDNLAEAIGAAADSLTAIEQTTDRSANHLDRLAEVHGDLLASLLAIEQTADQASGHLEAIAEHLRGMDATAGETARAAERSADAAERDLGLLVTAAGALVRAYVARHGGITVPEALEALAVGEGW